MARAKIVTLENGQFYGIRFNCPGCAQGKPGNFAGAILLPVDWTPEGFERAPLLNVVPTWGFNGDLERPTFTPSILTSATHGEERTPFRCHSFVRDGRIEFLSGCTHALAGQTLDLPELVDEPEANDAP